DLKFSTSSSKMISPPPALSGPLALGSSISVPFSTFHAEPSVWLLYTCQPFLLSPSNISIQPSLISFLVKVFGCADTCELLELVQAVKKTSIRENKQSLEYMVIILF